MKKMTKAQLEKIGAKKIRSAPGKPQPEKPESMSDSVDMICNTISNSSEDLSKHIAKAIKDNSSRPKPIRYKFIINRDKRGLIESADLIPET